MAKFKDEQYFDEDNKDSNDNAYKKLILDPIEQKRAWEKSYKDAISEIGMKLCALAYEGWRKNGRGAIFFREDKEEEVSLSVCMATINIMYSFDFFKSVIVENEK